ncbi:MAG: coiled-coil domain-containing protein [Eggerthella lenta]
MQQQAMRARKGVFAGAVAAALAATLMIPSLAYADPTASEKQAEAQAALASLNSMQSTLNRTSVVYDEALAAQREAEAKRDEAQARIDEANGQIADLQTRLGSRARSMYRTGGSSFLDLLLGATTFQEFSTGWDMLNTLNENDADLVQQTKDLRAEVQEQQAAYAEQQRVAAEKADEALRSSRRRRPRSAMQATYDSLSAEAAELLEQGALRRQPPMQLRPKPWWKRLRVRPKRTRTLRAMLLRATIPRLLRRLRPLRRPPSEPSDPPTIL